MGYESGATERWRSKRVQRRCISVVVEQADSLPAPVFFAAKFADNGT
jgi:hypothetical protein